MSKYEQNHKISFIVLFFIIALILNGVESHSIENARQARQKIQQEQQHEEQLQAAAQTAANEQAKAMKEAAADRSNYLARYLNSNFSRKPGIEAVAVCVASEKGTLNQSIARAIANHLNTDTIETLPAFFKQAFVSDGLINDTFDTSSELRSKLELTNSLDGLLLAYQSVEYSGNPSLENVLTATIQLKVVAVSLAGNSKNQTWTFTEVGSGFSETDARAMAEERLIKQINADTNISLNIISPNNQ